MASRKYNLPPISGKGFGGKAVIVQDDNESNEIVDTLKSYDKEVAFYNHATDTMTVLGWYSKETLKHINAFLVFYNRPKCSKPQLIKRYNLTENI